MIFQLDEGLAQIALNRPEATNTLNRELAQELLEACRRCARPDVRAVAVAGEGRALCAGGGLKEIRARLEAGERMEEFPWPDCQCAVAALYEPPRPTVAAVRGLARAARLAPVDARVGQAYARAGLVPDCGGTFLPPRVVGQARALEMILTGEAIGARRALAAGPVRSVHPAGELMEEALAPGRRLAGGPNAGPLGREGACQALGRPGY